MYSPVSLVNVRAWAAGATVPASATATTTNTPRHITFNRFSFRACPAKPDLPPLAPTGDAHRGAHGGDVSRQRPRRARAGQSLALDVDAVEVLLRVVRIAPQRHRARVLVRTLLPRHLAADLLAGLVAGALEGAGVEALAVLPAKDAP